MTNEHSKLKVDRFSWICISFVCCKSESRGGVIARRADLVRLGSYLFRSFLGFYIVGDLVCGP